MNNFVSEFLKPEIILIAVILPVTTVIGFIIKVTWDRFSLFHVQKHENKINKKISVIENKLKNFYWPLYIRLQRDEYLWELAKITLFGNENHSDDECAAAMVVALKKQENNTIILLDNHILENHNETLKIIDNHMVDAEPSDFIMNLIKQYNKHVMIYKFLRNDQVYSFPKYHGVPYPIHLKSAIETRVRLLQKDYNKLTLGTLKEVTCNMLCKSCNKCVNYECNEHNEHCNCV